MHTLRARDQARRDRVFTALAMGWCALALVIALHGPILEGSLVYAGMALGFSAITFAWRHRTPHGFERRPPAFMGVPLAAGMLAVTMRYAHDQGHLEGLAASFGAG